MLVGSCILVSAEYWLWTWCLASYVSSNKELVQVSFCESSDPLLRPHCVLSEVSEFKPFVVVGDLPRSVWNSSNRLNSFVWNSPDTNPVFLCLPCGILPRVLSWRRRLLSCFLMLLWIHQFSPKWMFDHLSIFSPSSNDHSYFRRTLSH